MVQKKIIIAVAWLTHSLIFSAITQAEVTKVVTGFNNTCILTKASTVKCWGENWHGAVGDGTVDDRYLPVNVSGLSSIQGLESGDGHACALTSGGGVKCWGYNYYGQIGDGTDSTRTSPVNVSGLSSGIKSLALGFYHSCALTTAGGVKCWGSNYYGQLGDGSTSSRLTPVNVVGLSSGVSSIWAGTDHTCAILSTGAVKCWGSNGYGQLGDNSYSDRLTPTNVFGLTSGIKALAGGDGHTCALTNAGAMKCWGYNSSGQLGIGHTYTQLTPVGVSGLSSGVVSIGAGWNHTCAVNSGGAVKCWGYNGKGQLGDSTIDSRSTPTDVVGLSSGFSAVATGPFHACAQAKDGGLKCWGENSNGEVGDGTITQRLSPVNVKLWKVNGRITINGSSLKGITVTCGKNKPLTDSSGRYSFGPVIHKTSCKVTPSKYGYTFSPSSASLSIVADYSLNFTAKLTDSDRDGLADLDEDKWGTDPQKSDTDGDGIKDGQEVLDQTSPTDAGSFQQVLSSSLCSEWNGFLGMTNIVEHVNLSSNTIEAVSRLYNISGETKAKAGFSIKRGGQYDLIANSLSGFSPTSYGKICSSLTKGNAGDLDGRMVYYKPDNSGGYQFVFAMPFGNGLAGRQYVQFNTWQPSQDTGDRNNLVTNWVQVTNLTSSAQKGTLNFFRHDGDKLQALSVNVPAGGRVDIDAHRFGKNQHGLVEWVPGSSSASFQLRNVRYYYDNASANNSFDGAYQWEGRRGTGVTTVVPLDTRSSASTVFVSNTSASRVTADVQITSGSGRVLKSLSGRLDAHSSWSIDVSDYLDNAQGTAIIKSSTASSLVSTVTQVGLNKSKGIQNLYAVQATQPVGTVLSGSYNTFLNQKCRLLLANPTSAKVNVSVTMKRYDGTTLLKGKSLTVPAKGLYDYDLCSNEKTAAYGLVTVQPTVANSIMATVLRLGASDGFGDSYRFPTPVRE